MKLQDSVIAITGGGQGLGRAMAEYLAAKFVKWLNTSVYPAPPSTRLKMAAQATLALKK